MSETPVYAITHLLNNSANPEIVVNAMFDAFEQAMNGTKTWVITTDTTVTQAELAEAHMHILTGAPGAGFDFDLPAGLTRRFAVRNDSGQTANIQVIGGAGLGAALGDEAAAEFHSDGTDIIVTGGAAVSVSTAFAGLTDGPGAYAGNAGKRLRVNAAEDGLEYVAAGYDFGFTYLAGPPVSDEVIGKVIIPRAITLPANFAGAFGHIDTNPTATFALDVTDDGVSIGTVSISTIGVFTFTTDGGTAKAVAAGSVLRFVAPNVVDATAASFAGTLIADLT